MLSLEVEKCDISFKDFYSVLARYLLEQHLIDCASFDEKHLVVNEIESDSKFEFILLVKQCKQEG